MDMQALENELIRDEDLKLKPYVDTKQKTTIGIGRNLTDVGISRTEALILFDNDVQEKMSDLDRLLPWWRQLNDVRQRVLVNMAFNMGVYGLITNNPKMLAYLKSGLYDKAAAEMLNGPWKTEVGDRAQRLSEMIKNG